jgi:hypothetical protein
MLQPLANLQKLGQENLEATIKALGAFSANAQVIATETADYARKSFEYNSSAVEKLAGATTLDKAIELQSSYMKDAYDGLVSQSTKMGALYTALAADTFKPFEGFMSKVTKA